MLCFFILVLLVVVRTDYVLVNWNVSSRSEDPHPEREYEHPMYENVAPVPCDLTDGCDAFCPLDQDCSEIQKVSFSSSSKDKPCDGVLSRFNCDCDEFDKPEFLNWLCFVRRNPIYLGKFYETPKKIERMSNLKRHLKNSAVAKMQRKLDLEGVESSILTFAPLTSEMFPSLAPLSLKNSVKDSSFACKTNPVRFRNNQTSVCHTEVTYNTCENGYGLSVIPYLVGESSESEVPVVVKDLNHLKGLDTEITVSCVETIESVKKIKKHERKYFDEGKAKPCREMKPHGPYLRNNTCHNVLVFVKYKFTVNGSELIKLQADYGVTDIVLYESSKYNYIKQKFKVGFIDVGVNEVKNVSRNDDLYNRGYLMGEELNFGYKLINNSIAQWTKGIIGVFTRGDSCERISPIAFGHNYMSVCSVRENLPDCSRLRAAVESKLENLIQGESLATHANFRPPYNNTVPVVRNYPNSTSQTCSIPVVQTVLIQYTTVNSPDGRFHRVIGLRVDREYNNTSLNSDFALAARVRFIYVSSYKSKRRSRFWTKMYSPELSETSWLNILNAFDDMSVSNFLSPSELQEKT